LKIALQAFILNRLVVKLIQEADPILSFSQAWAYGIAFRETLELLESLTIITFGILEIKEGIGQAKLGFSSK
jgi:formylmethanofuran dehydrogenase subunit E-like metal-binding protein